MDTNKADQMYWMGAIIPILEKRGVNPNYDTTILLVLDILNASNKLDKLKKEPQNKTFDFEKLALAQAVIDKYTDWDYHDECGLLAIDCNFCEVEIEVDTSEIEDGTIINDELVSRYNLEHQSDCPVLIAKKVIQEFNNV